MTVTTIETNPDFADWPALESLLRIAYAPMEGRIDPPSSLVSMSSADIAQKAQSEDLYLARDDGRPVACGFGRAFDGHYEIGKLAVATSHRSQGLARQMIEASADRARALGHDNLRLYARIELIENHIIYQHLGFVEIGTYTHPGFDYPTALLFQRPL